MSRLSLFGRAVVVAVTTLAVTVPAAGALPVPDDLASYELCGRVFPDPHAFWPAPGPLPLQSPFAKGSALCRSLDFLGWDETIGGLRFLEELLPDFVEVYDLSDPDGPLAHALDLEGGEGRSAGLPTLDLGRERVPMYLVRITDEASTDIPIEERAHFVFGLSIHGSERAGVEGGIRAAEDLATWAACEGDEDVLPTCAANGPFPHPILETMPDESTTAGDALRRSSVWFVLLNPDGWRRGDKQGGGFFFQRYNGNGMDLNRDWANEGFTYRPFTPFSEPETRGVAKALEAVKDKWTGGIDLHGQLIDRAFSFTLIGGNQRPYDKDRRVLQFVKGAWADAEERLSWSPVIKGNDEPEACVPPSTSGQINPPPCDPLPRMYGVQWGTIWDTIAYTTSGAFGDWVDSPLGLDADGIDNEMSLSHLSNCGIGSCYLTEFEQLHVDGNKSLIYSMLHYSLVPEDTAFRYRGRAGWLHHDGRVSEPASPLSTEAPSALPVQDPISMQLLQPLETTYEFDVRGPAQGVSNGGLSVQFTAPNVAGVSLLAVQSLAVDKLEGDEWQVVNSYYNQSPVYLQAGARVDVNLPEPGRYRVRTSGEGAGPLQIDITFTDGPSWPDPGQRAYDVSNLDFFRDLRPFAGPDKLAPAPIDGVAVGTVDLAQLDSLVIADGTYRPASDAEGEQLLQRLRAFVEEGGNLVLTDDGVRVLARLGFVPNAAVRLERVYAGHVEFSTDEGTTDTYADPLAKNVDQPGAAEGPGHRHQTSEPVPTGWKILGEGGGDFDAMPEWVVDRAAFESAGGRVVGMAAGGVALGELPVGEGRITLLGSLLPVPTTEFDHPYGLSAYGVTYSGYELLRNLLDWVDPSPVARPDPAPLPGRLPATGGATDLLLPTAAALLGAILLRRLRHS